MVGILLKFIRKLDDFIRNKDQNRLNQSKYISRDLSWVKFNYRVLDQAKKSEKTLMDKLKFMAITASTLDEFFMIRVGSLYNYIDNDKPRIDYSGLRLEPFRKKLLSDLQAFVGEQYAHFNETLKSQFGDNDLNIIRFEDIKKEANREKVIKYFDETIFPMVTPMLYDSTHTFPMLQNRALIFGVITSDRNKKNDKNDYKLSFVQIPQNLSRFYEIDAPYKITFIPIEEIIRSQIHKLFRNVEIQAINLFRITRNGDFSFEESDDIDENFLEELKKKVKTRKSGRVVRLEIEPDYSNWMMRIFKDKFEIDDLNVFEIDGLFDLTSLSEIGRHPELKSNFTRMPDPVSPLSYYNPGNENLFEYLKDRYILLHHPYNSINPVLDLLDMAAEDPNTLAIKITIYRLAKQSRITAALLKAAENGKHVSVLFEAKARFDEENNMIEGKKLEKAGCFVIYGIGTYKTHTKLMLIVRQEDDYNITRYVHMSSGNYNEDTSRFYSDISMLTTNQDYANDVSEFFNVITGHSVPQKYRNLITAPRDMRQDIINLIKKEVDHAQQGLPAGIVWKANSLQDKEVIDALYEASQAGVPVKLIIRGICCLRPGREGLSDNIEVYSIVGEFLEHSRLYYFHNNNDPLIYSGSADIMVRSFDRRIESLYVIKDEKLKKEAINILVYNLSDNVNNYRMNEDGTYSKVAEKADEPPFNIHYEFFKVTADVIENASLF